jgi:hypothetical protein
LARSTNDHIYVERPATTHPACFASPHVSAAPTAPRGQFSQRTRMGTANKLSPNRTADAPS